MSRRARSWLCALAAGGTAVAITGLATAQTDSGYAATRAAMRQIFASMEILLPLSADEAAFESPSNRERIDGALATMVDRSGRVGRHLDSGDWRFRFLGTSLEWESRETLERFRNGETEAARFFVQRMTDFCVACHTALPSPGDSPVAADFVTEGVLSKQPPERRATLQIATRRFDDGLKTLEALITDPAQSPAGLLMPLTQYLTVSIRVKRDPMRPVPTLRALAKRDDLWDQLRADVGVWIETLEAAAARPPGPPELARARAFVADARDVIRFPTDRRVLVHYLLASSELHRYLELHKGESTAEVAEAYYWLGLVETRLEANPWVAEASFYLESAIRTAPRSDAAKRAYDLLEEETILGWTGSAGTHVPPDVEDHLEELRALVENGKPL